jgi:hypothetical protein
MKKIITFIVTLAAVLFLAACLQPISEVKSFTLSGWTPKDYYGIGDPDAIWPGNVTLNVVYQDNQTETLNLGSSVNDGTVTVTGDYVESPLGLNTVSKGHFNVTISVDNVSLTFEFYVFNLDGARYVGGGGPNQTDATISSALSNVSNESTIIVANGTYNESLTISGKTGLTIYGESENDVILNSSNQENRAIFVTGSQNLTMINMTVKDDYSEEGTNANKRFMFKIQSNSHNITLRNITIEGPGKERLNTVDSDEAIGGLDLNGINGAVIEDVTVTKVSRNAMAFASVTNLVLRNIVIEEVNAPQSGWSAIALYRTNPKNDINSVATTLVEITGSINNANIAINYDVPPYEGFEFGSLSVSNVAIYLKGAVTDPIGNPDNSEESTRIQSTNAFALNVIQPSAPWRVEFTSIVNFGTEDNEDYEPILDYFYFTSETDAEAFVAYLQFLVSDLIDSEDPIDSFLGVTLQDLNQNLATLEPDFIN